jgi:hypothetical protein
MTQNRRKTLSALVILASPLAFVLTYLICRQHVPDRIPNPWDWTGGWLFDRGDATRGTDFLFAFAVQLPSWLFLTIALVQLFRSDGQRRGSIIMCNGAGSMGLFLWIKTMIISYGAANLREIQPQFWQYLLTFVALGAYSRLLASVLPIAPRPAEVLATSPISLEPGRRVMWFGQATSSAKLWGGLALVAAAVGVAVISPSASIAILIVAGLLMARCVAKVRIDDQGLSVARGLGWPKFTIPLAQVAATGTHHFDSFSYRNTKALEEGDPRSLLVRRGDALVVEAIDRLPLYVSVDRADEAANVLNALVARLHSTTSPPL